MKNSWNQRRTITIQKQENFAFDLVKNKQTKVTWVNDNSKSEKNKKNSWNRGRKNTIHYPKIWKEKFAINNQRKNIIQMVWPKKISSWQIIGARDIGTLTPLREVQFINLWYDFSMKLTDSFFSNLSHDSGWDNNHFWQTELIHKTTILHSK